VLWALLEDQPRLDGAAMEQHGLGKAVQDGTARDRAVQRIDKLAAMSREAIEAYVDLSRSDLRARFDAYLARALDHQVRLLASPGFQARVARARG
jgi:hypothetical protein